MKLTRKAYEEHLNELVHITRIRIGDTVIHNGHERTVCKRVLKTGGFMGTRLWGDSYHGGNKLVKRITVCVCHVATLNNN